MSKKTKKLQIELTSCGDNVCTWRAVGAREPKGDMEASLLPPSVEPKTGDVFWAETLSTLDGIEIAEILLPQEPEKNPEVQELKVLGPEKKFEPVVLTSDKKASGKKHGKSKKKGKKFGSSHEKKSKREKAPESSVEKRKKGKKLMPKKENQRKWLEQLPEEHKPIAEKLIEAGMPAVRKENPTEGVTDLAEKLMLELISHQWRDKAETALKIIDEVDIKDLRAVLVAAENLSKSDNNRKLKDELQEKYNQRIDREYTQWLADISTLLEEGRIVKALRWSGMPPKAGQPFPEELKKSLAMSANDALSEDTPPLRWKSLLEAAANSPARINISPSSLPRGADEDLMKTISALSVKIPGLEGLKPTPTESQLSTSSVSE